jgi:hypothetical protein
MREFLEKLMGKEEDSWPASVREVVAGIRAMEARVLCCVHSVFVCLRGL